MHIVILHESAPNPIRVPLFNRLAEELAAGGDHLTVVWLKDSIADKDWDMRCADVQHESRTALSPARVARILISERPDVVISSYASLAGWIGWAYAVLFRRALVNWSGTWELACNSRTAFKSALKRLFVRSCRGFVSYGSKSGAYLEHLGARPAQIEVACNVADIAFYRDGARAVMAEVGFREARRRYRPVLLITASRLVRGKGLHELLTALERLRKYDNWELVIAGRGIAELELRRLAETFRIAERVRFVGFLDRPQLVRWFALADVFIQPSLLDRFSLVMSEALHAGLYCIGSPFDGASYDLIKPGINGEMVDPRNTDALVRVLNTIFADSHRLPSREQVTESVAHYTIERYAAAIARAVRGAPRSAGFSSRPTRGTAASVCL